MEQHNDFTPHCDNFHHVSSYCYNNNINDNSSDNNNIRSSSSRRIPREMYERHCIEMNKTTEELYCMIKMENDCYGRISDYLDESCDTVNDNWRRKICQWCFEVVDHFGFDREVVSIALNFLDRTVAALQDENNENNKTNMERREFQLIAVTSLYMAIKVHGETDTLDGPRRKMKIGAYVELSRGLFTIRHLEDKERDILKALAWRVNPPTTVSFVASLLKLMPLEEAIRGDTSVYEMARYLSELAVCVSRFAFQFTSSQIALACIMAALEAYPIHYHSRVQFLNSVTQATGLALTIQVRCCQSLVMDMVPQVFSDPATAVPESPVVMIAPDSSTQEEETTRRESPVSVLQDFPRDCNSGRKRGRPS